MTCRHGPSERTGGTPLTGNGAAAARPWWETAVVYQVYPRSFQDASGDGVGDLPGVTARLDHLTWLGIDAVWLSPVFRSPMHDFGYDIADHRDIDPIFGSLADADALIAAAHVRGLRVLIDFVPNHTSSAHPWFVDARSSRTAAHRDWYVWRDPAPDGGPPNDLLSTFGGPAWALDEATGQYWYHSFLAEQPELDWRNPAVREAMLDVLRFWFDRGVDGARIDVLWMIAKDEAPWRPAPIDGPLDALAHGDGPAMEERLRELREVADAFAGRVLIGELYLPPESLVRYYGADGRGVHLPFNFALVTEPWTAPAINAAIATYEAALPVGSWPDWALGNHDQPRIATRVGPAQARVAAMLLLTLRGTPTIYAGDELGLPDVPVPPARVVDVAGRDPQRSPMPWSRSGRHAGFSRAEPWLPMVADPGAWSVETQRDEDGSMLTLHRRLLALRRAHPALHAGSWTPLDAPDGIVAYDRSHGSDTMRVVLNLTHEPVTWAIAGTWRVVLGTIPGREGDDVAGTVRVAGDEGLVLAPG
jgi:alpha-glucosidase